MTEPAGKLEKTAVAKEWYIIHTYSGFEARIRDAVRERAEAEGLGDKIGEMIIPTEGVVEIRGGRKVVTTKKFFPGYMLVQLDLDEDVWRFIRNTPKVTGFVGGGDKPVPVPEDEVERIREQIAEAKERPKPKYAFEQGENVRIIEGPFANFNGVVDEVNDAKSSLKVMVTIFGRSTPVELNFLQVEKV